MDNWFKQKHHGLCGRGRLELFEPHRKAVGAVRIDGRAGEDQPNVRMCVDNGDHPGPDFYLVEGINNPPPEGWVGLVNISREYGCFMLDNEKH